MICFLHAIRFLNAAEASSRLRFFVALTLLWVCGCGRSPSEDLPPSAGPALAPSSEIVDEDRNRALNDLLDVGNELMPDLQQVLPQFRSVADESGIQFTRFSDVVPGRYCLPEVMGGGVAWVDFDQDGWIDLCAVNGCRLWEDTSSSTEHVNRFYRNTGRVFVDVTFVAGVSVARYGHGCTAGDFNADGFQDLYFTNYGRNTLLCANGDGTFSDVTDLAEVGCEDWSTSAVWLDANNDDLADLYVVNYLNLTRENHKSCEYVGEKGYCGPGSWDGVSDVLYLNSGDGKFMSAGIADGIAPTAAKGLAVAAADFDGDSIAEVYVANDMTPNFLLKRSEGEGASGSFLYRDVAVAAGCAVSNEGENEASMGIACSDLDGDGLVDIFLTDFYESKNTIYRNLGSLFFEDASRQTRIAATSFDKLGFGTVAFDANLDGADEIFIANGHVLGPNVQPCEMTQQLLLNDGKGIFNDVSSTLGEYFAKPCLGRGVAGGDYNNDGQPDLAVSHLDIPLALLRNETKSEHHFLGLELRPMNRCYPVGGRIVLHSSQGTRVVPIVGGGSYLSANDPRLLIGLGMITEPVDVEVHWSPESISHYKDLSPDHYWILPEKGAAVLTSNTSEGR